MAGGEAVDESQFKGLSKHFNSITNRGRANWAKLTYGSLALFGIYYSMKPKKAPVDAKK
ncbi:hypothetical protein LSTR_LSTR006799 [Laodelphax striatellus]|uniref:Up-regulated during skeletal muscle growth protein 5 n=1 Tax=Laodelphax striatellus TaxID=195883 RepID=A0A482WRW6_LAOST|nr:hypothetical protein LSTR_LSTR006799 [Laodelphax striatellus]